MHGGDGPERDPLGSALTLSQAPGVPSPDVNALDPSAVVPVRLFDARRSSWRDRLVIGGAQFALSLGFNLAVVVALVHIAFPRTLPASPEQVISVDLVPDRDTPKGAKSTATGTGASRNAAAGSKDTERPTNSTETKPASSTPSATSAPVAPAADPKAPQPAAAEGETPVASGAADTPPSIGTSGDPTARLVAAPADPRRASTQTEKNIASNAETQPADTPVPTEYPPSPVPAAMATSNPTAEPVNTAVRTAQTNTAAAEASAELVREAENTAKLAAALPFSQAVAPDPARAVRAGTGSSTADEYRGEVYGSFRKADEVVEAAKAKHLRGQTVVVFAIDDQGALTNLKVAISSGNPAVDDSALEFIRRSAPFPPPPPGGQHVFSPAIGFGLDEP